MSADTIKDNVETDVPESNQDSVFSNLPERRTGFVNASDAIPDEGEFTTATVQPQEQIPELEPKLYSIMGGDDDEECYSFSPPTIYLDSNWKWVASIVLPFKRGVISEEVLGEQVEVFFKSPEAATPVDFLLSSGVLIKEFNLTEVDWINKDSEQARGEIKDKVIMKYNQVVPNLVNQLNSLQSQIQQTQVQNTRRQQNKQHDDSLISL